MPSQQTRRYSSNLVQGGLEIPCVLKFVAVNRKEATKTKSLLESAVNTKDTIISLSVQLIRRRPRALLETT